VKKTTQLNALWREDSFSSALITIGVLILFCQGCSRPRHGANEEKADRIVVVKSARTLTLMKESRELQTYKIAIGRNSLGAKTQRGDHKTPAGEYVIDIMKINSRFHRALHISYPNLTDRERAQAAGINPGGDVEIHGIQNGLGWIGSLHRSLDWTDGCIAVTTKKSRISGAESESGRRLRSNLRGSLLGLVLDLV
jgi:murein L,D-transpeptidase YafK